MEHPVKILVVDDRADNLVALEVILGNQDYTLVKANSGKEALKILLKEQDFAIILMDVLMPIMDGFETAELIRQSEKLKQIPIIFLTANTDTQENIFKGYKTGAVDFMVKPLSQEILKAKIAVFADLYRKNRELTLQSESMRELNRQLVQQSKYVRSLIEASLDPMVTIDLKGKITDVNEALEKITGLPRSRIMGTDFVEYFANKKIAEEVYRDVLEKGSVVENLLRVKHADGRLTDVLCNGSVYKDDKGNVTGAVIVAREKMLSKYSRSLIEASLDPLITINSEGKITDMNEALVNVTGTTREKIKGTDFFEYFTEPQKAREVYREAFAKGFVVNFPLTLRHAEGKLIDVLFNGSVYKDERGNVLGIVIVARDVTEQKRFENELIEAKRNAERERQIAEEAVQAKQQFLSNMSHEIRTPMNAIIGFTKVILKTGLSEKQREYLNAIKLSGDALIVLINDILDLAKVDAGKMAFEKIPFKLNVSISAMLHLFEASIQEKNLELIKEYDEKIPDVLVGDPVRLHQIIMNLVSNATKFTSKGRITVKVNLLNETKDKVSIQFTVSDTGIGIPENKIANIFDNFQQATSGTARVYGGTGLGLAIVKQLVEAQGGSIKVKSKPGEGSEFSFTLEFVKTNELVETDNESGQDLTPRAEDTRVLVVEDVKLNQLLMKTLLEEYRCEMEIAANGKIAIEKLKTKTFDIIFMDLQMPEMNGFEATEYIRKNVSKDVPIIALTADVTTTDLEKCKAAGMNDYISKPIDDKLLFKKIVKYGKKVNYKSSGKDTEPKGKDPDKTINLDYLKQLTGNNHEAMLAMIRAYLEETPQLLEKMKEGIRGENWKRVGEAAHSIIPSFAIAGLDPRFEEVARKVIYLSERNTDHEEIKQMVSEMETACNAAISELKEELTSLELY